MERKYINYKKHFKIEMLFLKNVMKEKFRKSIDFKTFIILELQYMLHFIMFLNIVCISFILLYRNEHFTF